MGFKTVLNNGDRFWSGDSDSLALQGTINEVIIKPWSIFVVDFGPPGSTRPCLLGSSFERRPNGKNWLAQYNTFPFRITISKIR